jgi:hypothetical protein
MDRGELPKKILIIKDCTFILPDDFDGSIEKAFSEFLQYRANAEKEPRIVDEYGLLSTFNILLHSNDNERMCGEYVLYELVNGKYRLVDGTGYNKEITP